jgi:hypothetical protein
MPLRKARGVAKRDLLGGTSHQAAAVWSEICMVFHSETARKIERAFRG